MKKGGKYTKGESGNPKGRPLGTKNKIGVDLQRWIQSLIEKNISRIDDDLTKLSAKDRVQIIERLLQYCIPKQQSCNPDEQIRREYERMETLIQDMPDEMIDRISEKLMKMNSINKTG